MTPTPDQLALWAKLAAEATEGPWATYEGALDDPQGSGVEVPGRQYPVLVQHGHLTAHDAAFIAAARTAVPVLLARVKELEAWKEKALANIYNLEKDIADRWSPWVAKLGRERAALETALRSCRWRAEEAIKDCPVKHRGTVPYTALGHLLAVIDTALSPGLPGKGES